MLNNRRIAVQIAILVSSLVCGSTAALAASAIVTSGADSGDGTLRAALASGATKIIILPQASPIEIGSTLEYTNEQPLTIIGGGVTVEAQDDFTLLAISKGADLTIKNLNLAGIGGFDILNPSLEKGKGIFVDVLGADQERTGSVRLNLTNVKVTDVGYHGVHVSDCDDGDACGSGSGSGGGGSPASVQVTLTNVLIADVGYGVFDADGLRVDERDDGDILLKATNTEIIGVGADGFELDEDGEGDVILSVVNTDFYVNGGYCDPEVVIPGEEPYADDSCVEDDDGELVLDLDDGFDVDEAGDGSILGSVKNSLVNENLDEGLDFDESGEGGIELELINVSGELNGDEAIKVSEEDEGDVVVDLRVVNVIENGDDGMQIEEEGVGDLFVDIRAVNALYNEDSGIEIEQKDDGELEVIVKGTVAIDNGDDDLKVESDGGGTLTVRGSNIGSIDKNVDEI